ncbi:hypothetical protein PHYPO_G00144570 [Pangasianodon hypophthalmus]|uniref:Uncharacterized protein n=1 Tax=Pangasianodon hypophthalmus TaxID=310915 RepID=A0A5N5KCS8_PANHP|nr:hypothetical protein PHYPO_G00144570 [Pangasianodon hypophthalmus]
MTSGSKVLAFYMMLFGSAPGVPIDFIDRLKKRVRLRQVFSEEECDIIIAFVPIVSRAGTDIEAALQKIQTSQPVVLVILHHTFDETYIPPDSRWIVRREGVFPVDVLFYEDVGLLRSLHNDIALKSTTDYLISMGATPEVLPDSLNRCRQNPCWLCALLISVGFLTLLGLIVIFLDCLSKL